MHDMKRRERGVAVTVRRKEDGEFVAGLWRRISAVVLPDPVNNWSKYAPDAAARAARRYATHAIRVPQLRLAGFAIVATALALHNLYISHTFVLREFLLVVAILGAYCIGSWIVLRRWVEIAWAFHVLDIAACALVTYASGAEKSLLFFFLIVPVMNQTHFGGALRAVLSGLIASLIYLAMLLYVREAADSAIVRAALIFMATAYLALAAWAEETRRKRVSKALREARQNAEQRANDLATLNRITQSVVAAEELDEVLAVATREMVTLFHASSSGIALLEGGALTIAAFHRVNDSTPTVKGISFAVEQNPASVFVVENAKALIVVDAQRNPLTAPLNEEMQRLGVHSLMLLPLVSRGRVIGTLGIDTTDASRRFTDDELRLAETVAGQLAGLVDNARMNDRLLEMSTIDALTGIANRRKFDEVLPEEWRRAARTGSPFSLMMIDVDNFKSYNDACGHQAGDHVLREVAAELRRSLQRAGDFVARYGGEEFVVLMPVNDLATAADHAETLRRRVEHLGLPHPRTGVITVSIGLATVLARDDYALRDLIAVADQQLYAAKHGGRNRVCATHVVHEKLRSAHEALRGEA